MNLVSIIMSVYDTNRHLLKAIDSVLNQTMPDFELLVIYDQSSYDSMDICRLYQDSRIRIIQQNRVGMSGAKNTGIMHAKGSYIAFLNATDYWAPEKLEIQLQHLHKNPKIGVSYCPSIFVDDNDKILGIKQSPKLTNIKIEDIFCRNPISNGSTPIIRKSVLKDIRYFKHNQEYYFDETLKHSEDFDCWLRIATQSNWGFEGVKLALTYYRVNDNSLTVNVVNQFNSWKRVRNNLQKIAPDYVAQWGKLAEAYQLRYLCRCAIRSRDNAIALKLALMAITTNCRIIYKEPIRTLNTLICAGLINLLPRVIYCYLETSVMQSIALINNLMTSISHSTNHNKYEA